MAKKAKSYSFTTATDQLNELGKKGTPASELVYELLRIFSGFGDGQVARLKDGRGNSSKDGRTILVKNLIAYRPSASEVIDDLIDQIEVMKVDSKISKQKPRLYVVSNGKDIVVYDPKINDWYDNKVELLWSDFDFLTPLAGIEKVEHIEEAEADVKSAELMAKLFDDIRRYNDITDPTTVHALNVFMSRLLFCFFAEDTGLFHGENLFTNTLRTHTKEDGSDLSEFIDRAFLIMSTDDPKIRATLPKLFEVFPYVNGGLFKEHFPIPVLSRRARTLIINCGEYNWREINPDIFGSMIQAVVTPEQRAGLGMHYTSVPNIEKLIKPLFLDELEKEFEKACDDAKQKKAAHKSVKETTDKLNKLLVRLSKIKFFDPACGSGNFLIISYKRVRELEIRIWKAMRDIANAAILPFPSINLTQFYGIEIDEYACETATLSLWLAEHQMNVQFNKEFGVQPETLPLKPSGQIVCGNACPLDWNTVCPHTPDDEVYIMGNPPYLGSKLQDDSHKEDMQIAMRGTDVAKTVDYIAAWFWKGAKYIKGKKAKYAFVTTNSISQGEQVAMLWKPIFELGLEIFFARTSFRWSNNAKYNATVTVVIIGVQNKTLKKKRLFQGEETSYRIVSNISPYLVDSDNLIVFKSHKIPNGLPKAEFGSMPYDKGNLLLSENEKEQMIATYPESEKFIKRIYGSQEFINDIPRYCLWIDDEERSNAEAIPLIAKRIQATHNYRLYESKDGQKLAERPHQFREHYDISKKKIIVPRVSSERRQYIPIGFLDKDTVISDSAFAIYDAEMWLFALLTSKMHNLWVRAVGGALETRIRYSATLCYNTFPFPKLTILDKKVLEDMAQKIMDIRQMNEVDMTLGEMYNSETMPEDLKNAHAELDFAVERIYRAEPFRSDEERLEHLFKLYSKMTKK